MRDRAVLERRDDRAYDDVELRHAASDYAGYAELDEAAHAIRHARPGEPKAQVVAPHAVKEEPELQQSSGEDAPGLHDTSQRLVPADRGREPRALLPSSWH